MSNADNVFLDLRLQPLHENGSLFRLEEIRTFYKFRPDEIFRRINITALVALMIEVAKMEMQVREREISRLRVGCMTFISIQKSDLSSIAGPAADDSADSAIENEFDDEEDSEIVAAVAEGAEEKARRQLERERRELDRQRQELQEQREELERQRQELSSRSHFSRYLKMISPY